MANTSLEMTFTPVANRKSTGNIQLDNAIARIYVAYKRGNGAMQDIAIELYNIKSKELYKVNGIEHFSDFAENVLKISKSKASRMCAVAKRFLICTEAEEEENREKYNKFNFTQLSEMLTADDEVLQFINPEMTSKEIRDYINNAKRIGTNTQTDTDQNDTDQTDTEKAQTDTEQAQTNTDQTDIEHTITNENIAVANVFIDDEKSVFADEYSIKVTSDNEVIEATCTTLNGLKKIHTWLNKNKSIIKSTFSIVFEVENENTDTE